MRQPDERQPTRTPDAVDDQPSAKDRRRPRDGVSERGGAPPTKPAQPSGTEPLERDYWPQNQKR
jgi:hypothetical protein